MRIFFIALIYGQHLTCWVDHAIKYERYRNMFDDATYATGEATNYTRRVRGARGLLYESMYGVGSLR